MRAGRWSVWRLRLPVSLTDNRYPATCQHCGADLTVTDSVTREYVNKDPDGPEDGSDSVFATGHYDQDGAFESDRFDGFGGGNFDLLDDSDTCSACDEQL